MEENTGIDRSKFKATPVAKLKEQEIKANTIIGWNNNEWLSYHTIIKGDNKFRIYPARSENESWIYPKTTHFLPFDVEDKDKSTEKVTIKRMNKPIFNSRVHGGTEKDICEEYISLAIEKLKATYANDKPKLDQKLGKINGYKGKDGKFNSGIIPQTKWVFVSDHYKIDSIAFGLAEVSALTKEKMNKLSIIEENEQAICTDPFTDVDDGICMILNYNPDAKTGSEYYTPSLEIKRIDKFNQSLVPTPLTDENIKNWLKFPSLKEMFVLSYKKSDFDKALMGLEIFDRENEIGVFGLAEWDKITKEISTYYPEIEEAKDEAAEETDKELAKENNPIKSFESEKKDEAMDEKFAFLYKKKREELVSYIEKNKIELTIQDAYSQEDICLLLEDYFDSNPIPEEKIEEPKVEEKPKTEGMSREDRLKALKNKKQ